MRERIRQRKRYFLTGIILFFIEAGLLIWPVGLTAADAVRFLTGEGMWLEEITQDSGDVVQEFRPQYSEVKSIGFYLSAHEDIPEGSVKVSVTDADRVVIFEREIPYADIRFDGYTDVIMNLTLKKGKSYFLTLRCGTAPDGIGPFVGVCPAGWTLQENKALSFGGESVSAQLLTQYHYTDTISVKKAAAVLLFCMVTAAGLCFGLPDNRRFRKIVRILLFLTAPLILGYRLELLSSNPLFWSLKATCWNLGMMYLMELTVLLWTGSLRGSVILTNAFLTVLYTVSHYVYLFRGNVLRINDFSAVRTAAGVMGKYSLRPDEATALVWSVFLFFVVYGIVSGEPVQRGAGDADKKRLKIRIAKRLLSAAMGLLLFCSSCWLFLYTDFLERCGFDPMLGPNQQFAHQINGYLVAGCFDIQNSRMKKPEGYSAEHAEAILQAAAEQGSKQGAETDAAKDLPHVILIMNESFSDLRVLGNLQISEENMSSFYGLRDNTIRGYVNVSGLGGGTANSEFEVFTGCSMGLLPASYYPYQQCFVRPLPSLISHMKDFGYTTYSMHPSNRENYNRIITYDLLGFEHSLWLEDFEGAEKIHFGASDRDTYHKVEEIYENRAAGEKLFIFDMTIQNHGDYNESNIEQTVRALNAPYGEVTNFLSLMRESDEAFGELIDYFQQQDEKVIVCMFGDHQPKFVEEGFYESVYRQTPELTDTDRLMNPYRTPFVIWANYEIPEREEVEISTNYLGVLLEKTVGIPLSPYFLFLEELEKEFPVITLNGCLDADGNYHNPSEGLEEYRILQYRYLFDMSDIEWGY